MMKNSLAKEALLNIGYDKEDYLKLVSDFNPDVLIYYMELAFATGFDEGIKHEKLKHANGMEKPVEQIKNGITIEVFKSVSAAAKSVDRVKGSIINAAKNGAKCAGSYWKYC